MNKSIRIRPSPSPLPNPPKDGSVRFSAEGERVRVRGNFKFKIRNFSTLPSTNSLAKERAADGEPEGLVIVADYQTEGRGKPGRKWISPAGKNLLFSVLLRPPLRANQAPHLTQITCRSVASALKEYGIEAAFKRPNDILVHGKKICGVLVEARTSSEGRLESVVIGIGLNVNATPQEFSNEATCMREILNFKGRAGFPPQIVADPPSRMAENLPYSDLDLEAILKKILSRLGKDLQSFYASPL